MQQIKKELLALNLVNRVVVIRNVDEQLFHVGLVDLLQLLKTHHSGSNFILFLNKNQKVKKLKALHPNLFVSQTAEIDPEQFKILVFKLLQRFEKKRFKKLQLAHLAERIFATEGSKFELLMKLLNKYSEDI